MIKTESTPVGLIETGLAHMIAQIINIPLEDKEESFAWEIIINRITQDDIDNNTIRHLTMAVVSLIDKQETHWATIVLLALQKNAMHLDDFFIILNRDAYLLPNNIKWALYEAIVAASKYTGRLAEGKKLVNILYPPINHTGDAGWTAHINRYQ